MNFTFKFCVVVLACSSSFTPADAQAQGPTSQFDLIDRLNALEREIAEERAALNEQQAVLDQRRAASDEQLAMLAELQAQVSQLMGGGEEIRPESEAIPSETVSPSLSTTSGFLVDKSSLDAALEDPNGFFGRLSASDLPYRLYAEGLVNRASQPIFDRPNLPTGISAALALGNTSEASVNYSHPIILRKPDSEGGFAPRVANVSVGVFTPLSSGVGTLLSDTDRGRFNRSNRDVPTGTRVRVGFDFLSYPNVRNREEGVDVAQRNTAARRVVDVLYAAKEACLRHYASPSTTSREAFYEIYETEAPENPANLIARAVSPLSTPPTAEETEARKQEIEGLCSGDQLVRFTVGLRADSTTPSGTALINPELARKFLGAFWDPDPNQLPEWGWGISGEIGTADFTFRQAVNPIALVPDTSAAEAGFPDRVSVSVDPSGGFMPTMTESHNVWTVRGYGLFSLNAGNEATRASTPAWYFPGVTFLGSAEYSGGYEFRPGTTGLTICPAQPVDPITMQITNVSTRCADFNVDAPIGTDGFTLAAEARFRFLNVPLIRTLSVAPRYSYRLDDGAQVVDIPVYLQNDKEGAGSAGIRLRHRWGGRDLLGNSDFTASEISVFFVPLRFNGL